MDHGQGQLEKAEVDPNAAVAELNPGASGAERVALRADMGESYGAGYSTRSADEGYGERYGEAVEKVIDKKADKEKRDADVHTEYDHTQGHPVAQKEDSRHSTNTTA